LLFEKHHIFKLTSCILRSAVPRAAVPSLSFSMATTNEKNVTPAVIMTSLKKLIVASRDAASRSPLSLSRPQTPPHISLIPREFHGHEDGDHEGHGADLRKSSPRLLCIISAVFAWNCEGNQFSGKDEQMCLHQNSHQLTSDRSPDLSSMATFDGSDGTDRRHI
jgi:hypothetical protein